MKRTRTLPVVLSVLLLFGLVFPSSAFAAPVLTAAETVANVTAGTNDQTDVTTLTTANVAEVKATRTLTVGALPANAETVTIGTCTVTFATVASSTTHDTNCTGGASIDRTSGTGDVNLTPTEVATQLVALTNVSDTGHGALSATASSTSATSAVFTTTGTEASATAITFTDGTAGDITSTNSVVGVVPVAQVNTITIAGTVDTSDVFTATLPTVGAVTYTVASSDTTTSAIATGLNAAIQASSGYAAQAFTSAASTNTVVLTAKVAGTGFVQTSSASNRAAVAQVVTFAPSEGTNDYYFDIILNGTTYRAQGGVTVAATTESLASLLASNSAASCSQDGVLVTCTASTAGTAFTYSAQVVQLTGGGGNRRVSSSKDAVSTTGEVTLASLVTKLADLVAEAKRQGIALSGQKAEAPSNSSFTRDLNVGTTGADVRALQRYLNAHNFSVAATGSGSVGNETEMFGALTRAALSKFQQAKGISPAAGYFGPKTRAYVAANP